MTGPMMSYTQPNILSSLKLIKKNISAFLQQRPMELGTCRLILLQATLLCCCGNKTVSSYCRLHLLEYHCKEKNNSDANSLRYLPSYSIKIWLSLLCHHLANLHNFKTNISGMKTDI